jgi:TRAP transporter TAXI family solute receptor
MGRWSCIAVAVLAAIFLNGCGGDGGSPSGGRQFVTLGSAPVGGTFRPIGDAIGNVLNEFKGDNDWKVQSKGTKGSQQNIRELERGDIQLALSNSAISYHAVRGLDAFDHPFDICAVVTLAPNIGLFITKKDSGIQTIADLRNKRLAVGPAGAGFEMFLGPLLTAHGVNYTSEQQDFTPVNDTYTNAVALLGDGNIDAAFMGGATPTQAVTQACTSYPVFFVPYDEPVRTQLIEQYPFYRDAAIPAKTGGKETYPGMTDDFAAMDVGSMHLITSAAADEAFIYEITKTIWEHRKEIAEYHKAGNAINEQNAARFTGTPFHPGAERFYREIGIWPEDGDAANPTDVDAPLPEQDRPDEEDAAAPESSASGG